MNKDSSTFPMQKLPLAKKTKEWKEGSLDGIIAREGGGAFVGGDDRKQRMRIVYGLYNSEYSEEDLKYVTDPYKVEDGFPAKTQDFNIIKPKIDLLIGEESKRPFNIKIIQTNDDAITQIQEEKKNLLLQYIMSTLELQPEQGPDGQPITPEEIEKYMKYNYKSIAEETGYHALNYLKEKLNLPNEFLKGWKDALVGGEEIYYVGTINGEPVLERVNPLHCDYDKDPDLEYIEDGDWFVRRMEMSPATIADVFNDMMDESDLDDLLAYSEGSVSLGKADEVNMRSIIYKEKFSSKFLDEGEGTNLIPVWHGVWRSYKKVGFLTELDPETGEEDVTMVDETYKADPGEKIEWEWIPEVWEGYRVGDSIYLGIQPVEYQHSSVDNPSHKKLPYCGAIYNNTNSKAKSLVSIMKPLQYMYIILWYRLELTMARDKGKIITMDITQIPKGLGIDVAQWMHYLSALGVNFINPYDEGWDIPGREGGKPAPYNQMTSMDLTMGSVMAEYMGIMNKVEEMIGEISGVSKQRQGSIEQRELVGNVQRSVIQSSHITEPLFWVHNQIKKNALTMLLNVAKYAWTTNKPKKLQYITNDAGRIFLEVNPDFLYADMDVFVSDSTKEDQDIEAVKSLLQSAMQSGATLLEATEIISGDNMSAIKRQLADIDQKRTEMQQSQMQMEQQQAQMEAQLKAEDNRIKEEDSIRKAETAIQVALIQAESSQENDSYGEITKLALQKEKQDTDATIKDKQLTETKRQSLVAERQKEEEITIKRKQANKPNVSKTQ